MGGTEGSCSLQFEWLHWTQCIGNSFQLLSLPLPDKNADFSIFFLWTKRLRYACLLFIPTTTCQLPVFLEATVREYPSLPLYLRGDAA